jgi:hypothetical protein
MFRVLWQSALATPLTLIGGMFMGGVLGSLIFDGLPGHLEAPIKIALAASAALVGALLGGALWGYVMWHITRASEPRTMMWAGALGFGPTVLLAALALTFFENLIVERGQGPNLPIHNLFTMLFVPASAIVAGVGGFALAVTRKERAEAMRPAFVCALAGGLAFLIVNLTLETFGFRVGAPHAAERATMLTTALCGALAASIAGGAVIGWELRPQSNHSAMETDG